MHRIDKVLEKIGKVIKRPVLAVETGTCYVIEKENRPNVTTLNIIRYITSPNGILYSFDIDQDHIEKCKKMIVEEMGKFTPFVDFICGDSVKTLPQFVNDLKDYRIDLVCLDSKEGDPQHMLNEFNIISPYLAENHFILIDDIFTPNSVKAKKLVEYLDFFVTHVDTSYKKFVAETQTGMAIYVKNYDFKL